MAGSARCMEAAYATPVAQPGRFFETLVGRRFPKELRIQRAPARPISLLPAIAVDDVSHLVPFALEEAPPDVSRQGFAPAWPLIRSTSQYARVRRLRLRIWHRDD
jgi:hypothetical protein